MSRRVEHVADARRRELAFQHWSAEILRETKDRITLAGVERRALSDAEVRSDPELAQLIRGFLQERQSELIERERIRENALEKIGHGEGAGGDPAPSLPGAAEMDAAAAGRRRAEAEAALRAELQALARRFRDHLMHVEETPARAVVARVEILRKTHPDEVDAAALAGYQRQLERLLRRKRAFRKHIDTLIERAKRATREGESDAAGRALRRLSLISHARPHLLSDEQLHDIRNDVLAAGQTREHSEAARRLIDRERTVAAEIKALTDAVRRFHQAARSLPHDGEAYRRAEADYLRAAGDVRTRDNEWLAALILEMVELLDDWHTRSREAQHQVDRFIESVRTSLLRLREAVDRLERERKQ